jgi:hypothetical protein
MPHSNYGSRIENRNRCSDLHQDDNRCRHLYRSHGVHHDAQRTVVGIIVERVHVRYLDHGQQRQQSHAHDGRDRDASRM